jgi:hypothetical protein
MPTEGRAPHPGMSGYSKISNKRSLARHSCDESLNFDFSHLNNLQLAFGQTKQRMFCEEGSRFAAEKEQR